MLRRGVQFEITYRLSKLNTIDSIASFLKVLGDELKVKNINVNSLLNKLFLSVKHDLTDESLDKIAQWLKENSKSVAHSISNQKSVSKSQCQLSTISNDTFHKIGSYVSYSDITHLSQTNHSFHKQIHNISFFDACGVCNKLELTDERIKLIVETPLKYVHYGNLSYCKWTELAIDGNTIHCSEKKKCSFCTLIEQIEKYNNYDLKWFENLLSNVQYLQLSDNWPCLWNKIPLKWLLKKRDQGSALCTVMAASCPPVISDRNGRAFCENYESYFVNQCQSNLDKIRTIEQINFGSSLDYCFSKMNKNYSRPVFCGVYTKTFNCDTFLQFLNIFHHKVEHLRLFIFGHRNLCQILFNSTSNIYKDIIKDESVLSLKSFQSKYNLDSSILPCIERLDFCLLPQKHSNCRAQCFSQVLQLFEHSKLMSILQFGNWLKHVHFAQFFDALREDVEYHGLVDMCISIFEHMNQIQSINVELMNIGETSQNFFDTIQSFLTKYYFEKIVYEMLYCSKSNQNDKLSNFNKLTIGWCQGVEETNPVTVLQNIQLDDINQPLTNSCQQTSKLLSKQIWQQIEKLKEKTKPHPNDLSVQLTIVLQTHTSL